MLQLAVRSSGDFPTLAGAGGGRGCAFLWIVEDSEPDEYEETCGDRKASVSGWEWKRWNLSGW